MLDQKPEQHIMNLDVTHESGAEEWCCPICKRRMMIQWTPSFNWLVLDVGDEYASHSGAKGGLIVQNVTTSAQDEAGLSETDLTEEDESKLRPWIEWLDKNGFDNLWNEEGK